MSAPSWAGDITSHWVRPNGEASRRVHLVLVAGLWAVMVEYSSGRTLTMKANDADKDLTTSGADSLEALSLYRRTCKVQGVSL